MKSLLDEHVREELAARIDSLHENCSTQWGKMNVYQMLWHCSKWNEMMLGKKKVKQMFLGRLFGRSALKTVLKDDAILGRNSPTASELLAKEKTGDIALQKIALIKEINEYAYFNVANSYHPFFGAMTKEQVGQFAYKHLDHHLRQFGV
jgi:hypothetical protein